DFFFFFFSKLQIISDGNFLYNAVADQLLSRQNKTFTYQELRKGTAEYMRSHLDEFLPFLDDLQGEGPEREAKWAKMCDEVENTAAWGGQLELKALAQFLKVPIIVHSAEAPDVVM